MAKKKIDVEVGVKPTVKVKHDEIGKTHPMPEKQDEGKSDVSGQAWIRRNMICWNCQGISSIWYDTDAYHIYTCCFCGAANQL
jgi:hypothetical protein